MLCAADTVGVFQVESRAQMGTLPRVQPRCFYDLVIEVALIRPGPIQGNAVNPYIRRRRGEEPVRYLHPLLEPILERTLGVPLFQEQLMEMAVAVAGFTPAEADELRQAMAAKRSASPHGAAARAASTPAWRQGGHRAAADQLFEALAAFANFGFPESHSVSFAHLVYCSAWIKLRYPAAFFVGMLNAQPMGFWSPQSLLADAQRHGVRVRRPDVNCSARGATLEGSPERARPCASASGACAASAPSSRRASSRVAPGHARGPGAPRRAQQHHLEALAAAGALDGFGPSRRALAWAAGAAAQATPDRLAGVVTGLMAPALRRRDRDRAVADDLWSMGLTPDATAIALRARALNARGVSARARWLGIESAPGRGRGRRHPPPAPRDGQRRGLHQPRGRDRSRQRHLLQGAWARWSPVARKSPALVIRGSLERGQGTIALMAESVEPLSLGATTPSRDWH